MRQFIRCAPGAWHFKAQAQVWKKTLLNHAFIQLPLAEENNQKPNKGERRSKKKKADSRGKKIQFKKTAVT